MMDVVFERGWQLLLEVGPGGRKRVFATENWWRL